MHIKRVLLLIPNLLLMAFQCCAQNNTGVSTTLVLEVKGSGTCFHFSRTGPSSGLLDGWACDPADPNQQFELEYDSEQWFRIKNVASGLYVSVPNASKANHVALALEPLERGDHQLWKKIPRKENWFALVAKHCGKCLDLEHGIKANGTSVLQWSCHPPSRWQFANQIFRPFGK